MNPRKSVESVSSVVYPALANHAACLTPQSPLKHLIDRNNLNLLWIEIQLVALDDLVLFQNVLRRWRSVADRRRLALDSRLLERFGVLRNHDDLGVLCLKMFLDRAINVFKLQLRKLVAHIIGKGWDTVVLAVERVS